MTTNDSGPHNQRGSRFETEYWNRVKAVDKQLRLQADASNGLRAAQARALRADHARWSFCRASRLHDAYDTPTVPDARFGPQFHESPEASDDD